MAFPFVVSLSFVGLLLPAATFADDVSTQLAADGKTRFVIVTPAEPAREEQTAATWLSETLEQVTGAKFPIRAAGKNDASDVKPHEIRVRFDAALKPEEWRIQTVGESLLLTGRQPRGAIHAVCEFLETHVGVEPLDPFTEFVPKQPTQAIPALNRRGRSAFPFRFVFTGWPYQNSLPQIIHQPQGASPRFPQEPDASAFRLIDILFSSRLPQPAQCPRVAPIFQMPMNNPGYREA